MNLHYKGDEYQRIEYTPYGETWVEKTSNTGSEFLPYKFTGKELDPETRLYYYGARYLDPKYSIWLSADPALGEYIPGAPVNDEARKHNQNLPGMGGVFNTVNLHLYHYAGNNPVKYVDPDGRAATVAGALIGFLAGGLSAVVQGKRGFNEVIGGAVGGAIAGAAIGFAIDTGGFGAVAIAGFCGSTAGSMVEGLFVTGKIDVIDSIKDGVIGMIGASIGYGISKAGTKILDDFLGNSLENGVLQEAVAKAVGVEGVTMKEAMNYLKNTKTLKTVLTALAEQSMNLVNDIIQDNEGVHKSL